MSSMFSSSQSLSKRSLTFNKSFLISLLIHSLIIFGISLTTIYKLPILKESPIINVKFANSNIDLLSQINISDAANININEEIQKPGQIKNRNSISRMSNIKKLTANSDLSSDEAVYLNLWQRKIESYGEKIISQEDKNFNGKVQVMAVINNNGELIDSKILISSGSIYVDQMALDILKNSAPFSPFEGNMSSEYGILEIVRDWNFSSN